MATNIAVMLVRQGVGVVIAIFATRWLLKLLGETEFGVLMALGASGALVNAISGSLSTSCQRHLAFEIGRGDSEQLVKLLNTAIGIFSVLAVLLTVLGALAQPLIFAALSCPPQRIDAAKLVYLFVLTQVFFAILGAPFRGFLIAHQSMKGVAALQLGLSIWDLVLIMVLLQLNVDALVYYSVGTSIGRSLVFGMMFYLCQRLFPFRVRPLQFEKKEVWRIFSFASWSSLGHLVLTLRTHVSNLILNFLFGPSVNAAFSVASRGASFLNTTQQSALTAILPALTGAVAKGEQDTTKKLMVFVSKAPFFATFPIYAVFMLHAEAILNLWLNEYPSFAPLFLRILSTALMIQLPSWSYAMALNAKGTIARITVMTFIIQVLSVVIVLAGFFWFSWPPWALPLSQVVALLVLSVCIAVAFAETCGLSVSEWTMKVNFPMLLVAVTTLLPLFVIQLAIPNAMWSLALCVVASVLVGGAASFLVGLNAEERARLTALLKRWNKTKP